MGGSSTEGIPHQLGNEDRTAMVKKSTSGTALLHGKEERQHAWTS